MRSKAPLALMEQIIMVLVFALAAALCVQVFVLSDKTSARSGERDQALIIAQSVVETLKASKGDAAALTEQFGGRTEQGMWITFFDKDWKVTEQDRAVYRAEARGEPTEVPGLGRSVVVVDREDAGGADPLAVLPAAWQEVSGHA